MTKRTPSIKPTYKQNEQQQRNRPEKDSKNLLWLGRAWTSFIPFLRYQKKKMKQNQVKPFLSVFPTEQ